MTPLLVALAIAAPTELAPLRSWRAEDGDVLRRHGHVVLDGGAADPVEAYALLNREGVPVLITLDSLYWALGNSHAAMAWALEDHYLVPDGDELLDALMASELGASDWLDAIIAPVASTDLTRGAPLTARRAAGDPGTVGTWPPPKPKDVSEYTGGARLTDAPAPPPVADFVGAVEAQPDAIMQLVAHARAGLALAPKLDPDGRLGLHLHFERSLDHYEALWQLAVDHALGKPLDPEQRRFLTNTVDHADLPDDALGATYYDGWFMDLLFDGARWVHGARWQRDPHAAERTQWLVTQVDGRAVVGPITVDPTGDITWLRDVAPWFERKPQPWPTTRFDLTVDEERHDLVIKVEASADIGRVTLELRESSGKTLERTLHVKGKHELRVHLPDDEGCCRASMVYLTIHRGPDRWQINDDRDHLIPVPVRVDFDATGVLITRADGETMRAP